MSSFFKETEKGVVHCSMEEWFRIVDQSDNQIKRRDRLHNGVLVSTIFLGIDHGYSSKGEPIVYETAAFWADVSGVRPTHAGEIYPAPRVWRSATLDEALVRHAEFIKRYSVSIDAVIRNMRDADVEN